MDVLRLLTDETDLAILQLLKIEPTYPRRLAAMLGKKEQKIVPRLKMMERAGLVRANWGRTGGKNVKVYETRLDRMELVMGVRDLEVIVHSLAGSQSLSPPPYTPPKIGNDPFFVGRKKELKVLSSRFSFAVLEGIAGIGKTSLLQAFVESLPKSSFVFWHTFKEIDSFNHVMTKLATFMEQRNFAILLDYIGGGGKDDSVKLDLLVQGLDQEGYVAIFDDCQNQHDEKIDAMLRHLQGSLSKAKVIVASRTRPNFLVSTSNLSEVRLEGLSNAEAVRLMRSRSMNLGDEELAAFCQRALGHPLALTVLSTILAKNPDKSQELMKELPIGDLIDELLRSLREEERSLLLAMSVFRNPIPFEGIANVVKLRGIRYLLQSLQKRLILNRNKDSYLLHELIREGCHDYVDFPEQLHRKIGEWYLARPGAQDALEGLYHLSRAEEWARIGQVLLDELLEEKFHFVEEGFSHSLLGILEDAKTSAVPAKLGCSILCVKARALAESQEWGRAKEALTQALTIAKGLDDPKLIGCVYETIGKNHVVRGDLPKAEANFLLSMGYLKRANDVELLKKLRLEMAKLYFVQGDVMKAMLYVGPKEVSAAITS